MKEEMRKVAERWHERSSTCDFTVLKHYVASSMIEVKTSHCRSFQNRHMNINTSRRLRAAYFSPLISAACESIPSPPQKGKRSTKTIEKSFFCCCCCSLLFVSRRGDSSRRLMAYICSVFTAQHKHSPVTAKRCLQAEQRSHQTRRCCRLGLSMM